MAKEVEYDNLAGYWKGEIERAQKRYRGFHDYGDMVVDAYRQQKEDGNDALSKDKYNILYSSTETIRPNLYAQTPVPRVVMRNKDMASNEARVAGLLLEGCLKYLQDEEVFDELMESAVEDYLLPGLGNAWVRYEATFGDKADEAGAPVMDLETNKPTQELLDEMVKMEYVYWQDMLYGISRGWKPMPWVARRCWMNKEEATKRFGKEKAALLKYAPRDSTRRESDNPADTAEVWEIWNKPNKTVYWYADGSANLLDTKKDPLNLKNFFPCPKPLRAIFNTRTFVPRALYSQYKSQSDTLNVLTKRIRLLGEALRVVGVYDGSQIKLADLLNPNLGNKMIAVDNWAMFAKEGGGINGSVQWLPIDQIVKVLGELLKSREVCKAEIYEITGFSDVVRGVSKASETLGAQNIKSNWASARIKKMQAEIGRFAKDVLAIAGELVAEHCSAATIAIFSGLQIPTADEVQADPQKAAMVQTFTKACELIKSDMRRVSVIDIETDSTLMANEDAEREDRAKFLAAAGAFLQQAVPAMEATPELGPLLGALLMFTARSFPSARIIEDEFEKVKEALAKRASTPKPDPKAAENAAKQQEGALKQQQMQIDAQTASAASAYEQAKLKLEADKEANRHAEKMGELAVKQAELEIQRGELRVKEFEAQTERGQAMHDMGMAEEAHKHESRTHAAEVEQGAASHDLEERRLSQEAEQAEADREQAQETARQQAQEGAGGGGEEGGG